MPNSDHQPYDQNQQMTDQQSSPPKPLPYQPKSIKVFGILHLVFGGLGILYSFFNTVSLFFQKKIASLQGTGLPPEEAKDMQEAYLKLHEKLFPVTLLSHLLGLILAILLIIAGLALVKLKANALQKNKIYAFTSIGFKLVMIILSLLFILPHMNEYLAVNLDSSSLPTGMEDTIANIAKIVSILTIALGMIYPFLSLLLLGKPQVKEYLEQQGEH